MKRIFFTVTNDLNYDQRMHRICSSLQAAGYRVTLVGRRRKGSAPLTSKPYRQKRLSCFFDKGPGFYFEYNIRLFFYLLVQGMDAVCAIDLDTILPCLFVSKWKRVPRVYDAHEYFTEMVELRRRPRVQRIWRGIERYALPKFRHGYTVSEGLAELFGAQYRVQYSVVRNLPLLRPLNPDIQRRPFLLVQGAVNEGRAFESLIPAMKDVRFPLVICGDGNLMPQVREWIRAEGVADKVELKGMVTPDALWPLTQSAALGLALATGEGAHSYHALPNKFLDYIQAGLPQLTMAFPEYQRINREFEVAVLIDTLEPRAIAETINRIMNDRELLERLHQGCLRAREMLCWQREEQVLLRFYQDLFHEA